MPGSGRRRAADLLALAAMLYPTAGAWIYFVLLEGSELARWVYLLSKGVQLALPLAWIALAGGGWPRVGLGRPGRAGVGAGIATGLALAGAIYAAYAGWLAGSPLAEAATVRIQTKLADFAVATPGAYLALATALSLGHSLFEELYWRWFVYGRAAAWLSPAPAVAVASLAFTAHHVVIARQFAPAEGGAVLVATAALVVAAGGAVWCVLFRKSGALLAPWISHLLVDAALMAVGFRLIWG